MEKQGLALANRLGLNPIVKRISLRMPWRYFSPVPLRWGCRYAFTSKSDRISEDFPDVMISIGRRSVAASLAVKELNKNKTFRIHLQHSGLSPDFFDLLVVPKHDRIDGEGVFQTRGAIHDMTRQSLDHLAITTKSHYKNLAHPIITVLLGGDSKAYTMSQKRIEILCQTLLNLQKTTQGSLLITPSRRTGQDKIILFQERLKECPGFFWDGSGENPYLTYLAHADMVFVTADSVNMITEATITERPVYILPLDGGSKKFTRFHDSFIETGLIQFYKDHLDPHFTSESIESNNQKNKDTIDDLVLLIREKLKLRGFFW